MIETLDLLVESLLVFFFVSLGSVARAILGKQEGKMRFVVGVSVVISLLIFFGKSILLGKEADIRVMIFISFCAGLVGQQIMILILKKPWKFLGLISEKVKKVEEALEDISEEENKNGRSRTGSDADSSTNPPRDPRK